MQTSQALQLPIYNQAALLQEFLKARYLPVYTGINLACLLSSSQAEQPPGYAMPSLEHSPQEGTAAQAHLGAETLSLLMQAGTRQRMPGQGYLH